MAKESLEYYGNVNGMPQDMLNTRLKKAQEEVNELSLEIQRRNNFTEEEKLADRLHRLLHFGTDCDFYYSDWPHATGCRADFRLLACNCLEWYGYATQNETAGVHADYPLGQLIRFLEVTRFGQIPL